MLCSFFSSTLVKICETLNSQRKWQVFKHLETHNKSKNLNNTFWEALEEKDMVIGQLLVSQNWF